jgi:hypothetical protein
MRKLMAEQKWIPARRRKYGGWGFARDPAFVHRDDGARPKGLIHDAAQPRVLRLVHDQHVVGDGRNPLRHPPPQANDLSVLIAQLS